jgi:uncharacterized BrkB/YihY/UPF0761 family membrane protein
MNSAQLDSTDFYRRRDIRDDDTIRNFAHDTTSLSGHTVLPWSQTSQIYWSVRPNLHGRAWRVVPPSGYPPCSLEIMRALAILLLLLPLGMNILIAFVPSQTRRFLHQLGIQLPFLELTERALIVQRVGSVLASAAIIWMIYRIGFAQ